MGLKQILICIFTNSCYGTPMTIEVRLRKILVYCGSKNGKVPSQSPTHQVRPPANLKEFGTDVGPMLVQFSILIRISEWLCHCHLRNNCDLWKCSL